MLFWPAEILLLYNFLESDCKVPARGHRKHMNLRTAQSGTIFFFLDFPRALRHHAPIPPRKTRTAHMKSSAVRLRPSIRRCGRWISRRRWRDKPKMKSAKSLYIALFAVLLLVARNETVRARTTQQTGDQAKGDSSTTTKSAKKNADSAATPKKNSSKSSSAPNAASAPVGNPPAPPLAHWAAQHLLPS